MKYIDEYRDADEAKRYENRIARLTKRPWTIMEVCGGQTHTIMKYGLDQRLPDRISLLHGPGCPVCVTPAETIDKAIALAFRPNTILCTFGDMLRVPGKGRDMLTAKAAGADIRPVYSPLDAVEIARTNPSRQIVFLAIGFETTAPATAVTLQAAKQNRLTNYSMLVAHVLIPPAMETLLASETCRIQGFLAPGHVCAVTGYRRYERIADEFHIPIVVTGFEPLDILQGVHMLVDLLERGRAQVTNQYRRAVGRDGNLSAQKLMQETFRVVDRHWRGLGVIRRSGLALTDAYAEFDAETRFDLGHSTPEDTAECISSQILAGQKIPPHCPAFGTRCKPEHPLGAAMVSSEGTCAAFYKYRQSNGNDH